jgi:TRAP-type C4-dicarboxylate transport system permease small subunit
MRSFWFFLDKLQDYMKIGSAFCIIAMAGITCCDVFLRTTFNYPIFGSEEIVSVFALLAMGFSLPYAHKQGVHIGVEIFIRLFSKKVQYGVKLITNTLSLILMSIISWRIFIFAGAKAQSGESSMNLELPMYYCAYVLSICFLIFSVSILKDILLLLTQPKKAVGGNKTR